MKRLTFLVLMLAASAITFAQKPVKPNLNKALTAWKSGKFDEAKEIVDLATTYEKTMNDAKTWYYRGLVYASLDTTSNPAYKSLAPDAFKTAMESFAKAEEMNKSSKSGFSIPGDNGFPVTQAQQFGTWANGYLNKGAAQYQEEDLENALKNFEKVQQILPTDTTAFFYGGFVANSLESYDKALDYFKKYIEKGGKSPDAYSLMININSGPKENKEEALRIAREAIKKFPANADLPKVEIGLLIDLNKVDEARTGLEAAIAKDPNNKLLHFYLGYVNTRLEKLDDARKNFQEALRVDPGYFEAQYYLSNTYLVDVDKLSKEINGLGISAADNKKKQTLVQERVKKSEAAIPYLEKSRAMKIPDSETEIELLSKLALLYYYVADDKKSEAVHKRLKELGADN